MPEHTALFCPSPEKSTLACASSENRLHPGLISHAALSRGREIKPNRVSTLSEAVPQWTSPQPVGCCGAYTSRTPRLATDNLFIRTLNEAIDRLVLHCKTFVFERPPKKSDPNPWYILPSKQPPGGRGGCKQKRMLDQFSYCVFLA